MITTDVISKDRFCNNVKCKFWLPSGGCCCSANKQRPYQCEHYGTDKCHGCQEAVHCNIVSMEVGESES